MKNLLTKNRRSLCVLSIMFSVMLCGVGISIWKTIQVQDTYLTVKKQFDLEHIKKYRAIEDADYLAANLSEFRTLNNRGVIGATDRIIWIAAFEEIRQHMALTDFHYEFGLPVSVTISDSDNTGLQLVTIDLKIGFTHDEALFDFFGSLGEFVDVSYEITQLDVERLENEQSLQEKLLHLPVNLIAISRISWFLILPPSKNANHNVQGA